VLVSCQTSYEGKKIRGKHTALQLAAGPQGAEKVGTLPERAKKDKSKATGEPVTEAYMGTSIERAFRVNAAISLF